MCQCTRWAFRNKNLKTTTTGSVHLVSVWTICEGRKRQRWASLSFASFICTVPHRVHIIRAHKQSHNMCEKDNDIQNLAKIAPHIKKMPNTSARWQTSQSDIAGGGWTSSLKEASNRSLHCSWFMSSIPRPHGGSWTTCHGWRNTTRTGLGAGTAFSQALLLWGSCTTLRWATSPPDRSVRTWHWRHIHVAMSMYTNDADFSCVSASEFAFLFN